MSVCGRLTTRRKQGLGLYEVYQVREEKSPALGITGSFVGPARMEPKLVEDRSEDPNAEDVEPVGQVLVRPSQTPDLKMGSQ